MRSAKSLQCRRGCAMLVVAGAWVVVASAEQPLGLVFRASGAEVVRPGRESPLTAVEGLELFAGDTLRTQSGTIQFSYCPASTVQTLAAGSSIVLDSTG